MIVDHIDEILYKYIDLRNPWNIDLVEFPVDIVFSKTRIPNVRSFLQQFKYEMASCIIIKGLKLWKRVLKKMMTTVSCN